MIPGGPTWPCSTGSRRPEVEVDAGEFLKAGESYRLLDPRDVFGKPVRAGTADGSADPRAGGRGVRRVRPDEGRRGGAWAMNRREMFTAVGVLPLASLSDREAGPKELPSYWTSRLSDVDRAVGQVEKGRARVLARSAGGRPIHLVTYGEAVDRR